MSKIRIILLNQAYPNPEANNIGNPFVHIRAKVLNNLFDFYAAKLNSKESDYELDGIRVKCFQTIEGFNKFVAGFNPDIFLIHFFEPWMYNHGILKHGKPAIIFVHGSEAHSWYRILFILHSKNLKRFFWFMIINTISLLNFRKAIKYSNRTNRIHFVFVSEWMKRITQFDAVVKIKNYSVIPNSIDNHLFSYRSKTADHRKKILLLRSFNSKKYANDLSVNAIIYLSNEPFFSDLEFHIYGQGFWWDKEVSKIRHFKNVKLFNELLPQNNIPSLHSKFGIFLCPTRMDSQGVSMCEAMSSGLVPITSDNSAISEFVKNNETGFLTNSSIDIADKIGYLYSNPDVFLRMSEKAASSIVEISGIDKMMEKEKQLVLEYVKFANPVK